MYRLKDFPSDCSMQEHDPDFCCRWHQAHDSKFLRAGHSLLNLCRHLWPRHVKPDQGPKTYVVDGPTDTGLHLDRGNAFNTMTSNPRNHLAIWHIWPRQFCRAVRQYVCKQKDGDDFAIHQQTFYMEKCHRLALEAKSIWCHTVEQQVGNTVYIPAGCYHQVRNLGLLFASEALLAIQNNRSSILTPDLGAYTPYDDVTILVRRATDQPPIMLQAQLSRGACDADLLSTQIMLTDLTEIDLGQLLEHHAPYHHVDVQRIIAPRHSHQQESYRQSVDRITRDLTREETTPTGSVGLLDRVRKVSSVTVDDHLLVLLPLSDRDRHLGNHAHLRLLKPVKQQKVAGLRHPPTQRHGAISLWHF